MMDRDRALRILPALFAEAGAAVSAREPTQVASRAARAVLERRPDFADVADDLLARVESARPLPRSRSPEENPEGEDLLLRGIEGVAGGDFDALVRELLAALSSACPEASPAARLAVALADAGVGGEEPGLLVEIRARGLLEAAWNEIRFDPDEPRIAAGRAARALGRLEASAAACGAACGAPLAAFASSAEAVWLVLPVSAREALDEFRSRGEREWLRRGEGSISWVVAETSVGQTDFASAVDLLARLERDRRERERTPFRRALREAGALGPFPSEGTDEDRRETASGNRRAAEDAFGREVEPPGGVEQIALSIAREPAFPGSEVALADAFPSVPAAVGRSDACAAARLGPVVILWGTIDAVLRTAAGLPDGVACASCGFEPGRDASSLFARLFSEARDLAPGRLWVEGVAIRREEVERWLGVGANLRELAGREPAAVRTLLRAARRILHARGSLSEVARIHGRIHEIAAGVGLSRSVAAGEPDDKGLRGLRSLLDGFPESFETGAAVIPLAYAVRTLNPVSPRRSGDE